MSKILCIVCSPDIPSDQLQITAIISKTTKVTKKKSTSINSRRIGGKNDALHVWFGPVVVEQLINLKKRQIFCDTL